MKKLLFFALSLGLMVSCTNKKSDASSQSNDSIMSDSIVEIIGEWQEIPITGSTDSVSTGIRLNPDNSAQSTNLDSATLATANIYQTWNQQGDTLTLVSVSAIDPAVKDTVNWTIVSLSGDSLTIQNPKHGTKKFARK